MAATAPTGEIWLGTIAKYFFFWCYVHVCQIWCFYHKMHDSLIFGHLAAGLMFRMLAGLHTVVCVQTHLVGRGERRWLVKYWVVCCAKIHQRVLMMTPPLPNPPCIPVTYLTRAGDLVCGWCRVSCCVVVSEARAASPSESHL